MKVRPDYHDGEHYFVEVEECDIKGWESRGIKVIDCPDDIWEAYCKHRAEHAVWNHFVLCVDNELHYPGSNEGNYPPY